ncbi:MAG: hypothetical protein IJ662_09720 [Clostridia bacterium]|nr:hypothetical protein [Clostridia bacterium]
MSKLHALLCHTTVILALMFLVFLILDQFNPMMNFVDNDISRWLLAALCLSGLSQSILHWRLQSKEDPQ